MISAGSTHKQIEDLRRQLHQGLGAQYDPARVQELVPLSQELDRLAIEVVRDELERQKEKVDTSL